MAEAYIYSTPNVCWLRPTNNMNEWSHITKHYRSLSILIGAHSRIIKLFEGLRQEFVALSDLFKVAAVSSLNQSEWATHFRDKRSNKPLY